LNKAGVYCILNTLTSCAYIGQAVNIPRRWTAHKSSLRGGTHHCRYLQRSWHLHGEEFFQFFILEELESESVRLSKRQCSFGKDVLTQAEQFWLDYLHSLGVISFNTAKVAGSSVGVVSSIETRAKRVASRKGYTQSAETRARISQSTLGRICSEATRLKQKQAARPLRTAESLAKSSKSSKGRKHSPEHVAKIAASNKGKTRTPEVCAKIAAAVKGKRIPAPWTPERRAKQPSMKGVIKGPRSSEVKEKISNTLKGVTRSPETRKRMSESKKKKENSNE
jgi:group I intron endonuclease